MKQLSLLILKRWLVQEWPLCRLCATVAGQLELGQVCMVTGVSHDQKDTVHDGVAWCIFVQQLLDVLAVRGQNAIREDQPVVCGFLELLSWAGLPSLQAECHVALIVCCLRWICAGVLCVHAPHCLASSSFSLVGAALCVHIAVLHQFHIFFRWGSPMCACSQWVFTAVHCCNCWINFQVEVPCAHALSCPSLPDGVNSGRGGWGCTTVVLQVRQSTLKELLPTIQVQGKCKQWHSLFPPVLESSLDSQRDLDAPLLYMVSLYCFLCRSCSIGLQLYLRWNCSKYRCTLDVVLRMGKLSIVLCCHLGPTSESVDFKCDVCGLILNNIPFINFKNAIKTDGKVIGSHFPSFCT